MNNDEITHFLNEGLIIDKETGEILTQEQYHDEFHEDLKNAISLYVKSCINVGENPKLELRKIANTKQACVPIKEKYHFNKVFRVDMQSLMLRGNLNKDELAFIGFMQNFIAFPNNDLVINHAYLSIEELSKIMGINRNALSKAIKSLEEKQVLKMIKRHRHAPIIYINPFLISSGGVIAFETYMMFKDTIYAPEFYID